MGFGQYKYFKRVVDEKHRAEIGVDGAKEA